MVPLSDTVERWVFRVCLHFTCDCHSKMGEKALQEIQGWLKDQGSLRARACLESSAELKKKDAGGRLS